MNDLMARVEAIFRDVLDDPAFVLTREASAQTVPAWDSLAHVNLVTTIEQEFDVHFALGELERLKNVGEMVDLIEAKLAAR